MMTAGLMTAGLQQLSNTELSSSSLLLLLLLFDDVTRANCSSSLTASDA